MPSKHKSVTFRENISPESFDESSSPAPITNAPPDAHPSLELDPMYLAWLRSATKAQYPFILNGTFAKEVYHQNFDKHYNMKESWQFQRVEERKAAVAALAEKYGSLGWGSLYDKVTEEAWVKNYREIYRFDGSDKQLLEKIAEAYIQIKRTIAEEERAIAQFTQNGSLSSPLSDPKWEVITQAGGALISPDFGPGGMKLPFVSAADVSFGKEEPVLHMPSNREWNGDEMVSDMGADFGGAIVDASVEL